MKKIVVLVLLALLLVGCGPSENTVQTAIAETNAARPTQTDTPMPTEAPTITPSNTPTTLPTETQTLTPSPTEEPANQLGGSKVTPREAKASELHMEDFAPFFELLENPTVTYYDEFNNPAMHGWEFYNLVVAPGVAEITGEEFWQSHLDRRKPFKERDGIIFLYKYDAGTEFEYYFDYGEWADPKYLRWGVYSGKDTYMNIFKGERWVDGLSGSLLVGNLTLKKDHWYYTALTIDDQSNLIAMIWDKDDPGKQVKYTGKFAEDWMGKKWNFTIAANLGKVYLDSYAEIKYDQIAP